MKKKWLVDKNLIDNFGLCSAFLHDELLQRYINNKDYIVIRPSELAVVMPFEVAQIKRCLTTLQKAGLVIRHSDGTREVYEIKEVDEI